MWGDVTTWGSPLGTSTKEAPIPPRLSKDVGIECFPPRPIATPPSHGCMLAGLWVQTHPLLPRVPRHTGSSPVQERSKLPLFPMAQPARWPGSGVWSRQRGCYDEGRMKAGITSASSPGESRAGAAALQQRAPSRDASVPSGERRDPLCHPHPLLRAKARAWGPVAASSPPGRPVPLLQRRALGCWMLHSLLSIPLSIPCLFPARVGSWGRRARPAS